MKRIDYIFFFKFQSDSINTNRAVHKYSSHSALNSNLILLIPMESLLEPKGYRPLNSNLILLIPEKAKREKRTESALNSNLILLIPC